MNIKEGEIFENSTDRVDFEFFIEPTMRRNTKAW